MRAARSPRADGEAGERGRAAVTVALRAHPPLADRRARAAPRGRGVGIGAEDRDLVRLEAAVAERRVRDEAGEPAADDRAPRRPCGAHFTEPASSPWTK